MNIGFKCKGKDIVKTLNAVAKKRTSRPSKSN